MPTLSNMLTDPDWSPSEADEQAIAATFAQRVAWEKAMAARGIKVHTLDLTPQEEAVEIEAWARKQDTGVAMVVP